MLGESFSAHFLLLRWLTILICGAGLWMVVRRSSARAGLILLSILGLLSWVLTSPPLARPYGLQPGSPSALERGTVSIASSRGAVEPSWLAGRENPRPVAGVLWYGIAPGNGTRARALYDALPLVLLVGLPWLVFWSFTGTGDLTWRALCVAFTAVFAATMPLDAFRPFNVFHRSFFVVPHRVLALGVAVVLLGLMSRGGRWRSATTGVLLGALGWLDLSVFAWTVFGLLAGDLLAVSLGGADRGRWGWPVASMGVLLAAPQIVSLLKGELLVRGLVREDVESYRLAFRDVFSVTTDMEWLFFFALLGVVFLWKRNDRAGRRLIGMFAGAYLLAGLSAWGFARGWAVEPDATFHVLRFAVAVLGGVGAYVAAQWAMERLRFPERLGAWASGWETWKSGPRREPILFCAVFLFLLPSSSVLFWHPLRVDPFYYPSWQYPLDPAVTRLQKWVLEETEPDEVIVSGADSSEWVAALTGRQVLNGVRLLPREDRRALRRRLNALFLSKDPQAMREAVGALGAGVLVLDPSLREEYWQLDPAWLEQSRVFRKVHQIGDRYAIYRPR